MAGAAQRKSPLLSIKTYRAFLETRSDKEYWELIDGVAMMMPPPSVTHQRIATNLLLLLHAALLSHRPALTVMQRLGINIGPAVQNYDPEPDVAVIDAAAARDLKRHHVDRFYLAAEVVSESDRVFVDKKRDIYKLHEHCTCVLTVQQDHVEVRVDLRNNDEWSETVLKSSDDLLVLADFGLRCDVSAVYAGTALQPG
jgi:Uma2 family endonuclease